MNSLRGFFYALLGRFFSFSLLYYIFVALSYEKSVIYWK